MYAKVKGPQLLQYPYDLAQLQADNPHTIFGVGLVPDLFAGTEAQLAGAEVVPVHVQEPPAYDSRTHNLTYANSPKVVGGVWTLPCSIVNKTAEELAQQDASKASEVRADRNTKLAASDWTQGKDIPDNISSAWATYRQALRDVPSQAGFPWTVQWPTQPE